MSQSDPNVDVLLVGGGIAGLWTLQRVLAEGYSAVLVEGQALGAGQTLASQGMIHGGLKYALGGQLTGASEAIKDMPDRWRRCFEGDGEIDLPRELIKCDRYYMYADGGPLGRLRTFFAGRTLRGRIHPVADTETPPALSAVAGNVYALNDFVVDTQALVTHLHGRLADHLYRHELHAADCHWDGEWRVQLDDQALRARSIVSCAGAGAEPLLAASGQDIAMQRRPLHQVLVHLPYALELYAHCLTGVRSAEPRLTLTTHPVSDGTVLYLGGQIATQGTGRDTRAQIEQAKKELEVCCHWLDLSRARYATLRIDRAEPAQDSGVRPDHAFVGGAPHFLQAWPTKLTLTPDLADRILDRLPPPSGSATPRLGLPAVAVGTPPWQNAFEGAAGAA